MAGHSILYLGRGEFAAEYLHELETLPCCALLTRSASLKIPVDAPSVLDLVLIEAGPAIAQSDRCARAIQSASSVNAGRSSDTICGL